MASVRGLSEDPLLGAVTCTVLLQPRVMDPQGNEEVLEIAPDLRISKKKPRDRRVCVKCCWLCSKKREKTASPQGSINAQTEGCLGEGPGRARGLGAHTSFQIGGTDLVKYIV